MAHKRMFSKTIIETDAFQDMSQIAQLLYFYLNMQADDDGFVGNPKRIMRAGGFAEDDMKILIGKRFLLKFDNGVVVIKHWLIHNTLRKDRYIETSYKKEKKTLKIKENKAYTESGNQMATKGLPSIEEDSIGKDRRDKVISLISFQEFWNLYDKKIDKVWCEKNNTSDLKVAGVEDIMNIFYKINPSLNWGNKTTRSACEWLIKKYTKDGAIKMAEAVISTYGKPYAPVATTPHQMKEKLAQFKAYFDREKNSKHSVTKIS